MTARTRSCIDCDYDLSATPQVAGTWRCPECGKVHSAADFEPLAGSMWSKWALALFLAPLMTIIAAQAAQAIDAFPWAWPLITVPSLAAAWCLSAEEAHWKRRRVRAVSLVRNLILVAAVCALVFDIAVLEWGLQIIPGQRLRLAL